jgi:hypothetical protein
MRLPVIAVGLLVAASLAAQNNSPVYPRIENSVGTGFTEWLLPATAPSTRQTFRENGPKNLFWLARLRPRPW